MSKIRQSGADAAACANCGRPPICRPPNSPTRCPIIWALARLSLPQLLTTTPCLDGFSRRFLRESTIFPVARAEWWLSAGGRRSLRHGGHSRRRNRVRRAGRGRVASFEDITTVLDQRTEADDANADEGARRRRAAIRRRHREPARSRQRRAGGARAQRSAGARGRAARQRHPRRAVPHRSRGAHARRRPAARDAVAARHSAAGADLAHQDSRRPQHRRTAPAAGRRGARARRPQRARRPRRHHADAAWRERRDPPVAARPRPAGDEQARARARATRA